MTPSCYTTPTTYPSTLPSESVPFLLLDTIGVPASIHPAHHHIPLVEMEQVLTGLLNRCIVLRAICLKSSREILYDIVGLWLMRLMAGDGGLRWHKANIWPQVFYSTPDQINTHTLYLEGHSTQAGREWNEGCHFTNLGVRLLKAW